MQRNYRGKFVFLTIICLFTAFVFAVDLSTPPAVDVWVFYLPVILSPVWNNSARQILVVAFTCSVLVALGSFSFPLGVPPLFDAMNRGMDILALWLTAGAAITIAGRSIQLSATMDGLRRETTEHDLAKQALAQSEGRLRLAIEGAHMGTWDFNLLSGRAVWSDTQFKMLGYQPAPRGEATLKMWHSRIHPDDLNQVLSNHEQARWKSTLLRDEFRAIRADNGELVWLAAFGRFIEDRGGPGVRCVGVTFDITHRKKLEREVLEVAEREQSRIGQELHDSVGQELTGLGLMANALQQGLDPSSTQNQVAGRLVEGIDRVHEQVRTLSRGLVPVQVEAKGLWAALDELAATTSRQSGIPVVFDCPERCEVASHNRATELFRIAQEAVCNALRHGKPHNIRLSLFVGSTGLRLSIQDDGVGLPPHPEKSSGMGLRIMEYRAQQIGGALRVGPAAGGGTIVTCLVVAANGKQPTETKQNADGRQSIDRR